MSAEPTKGIESLANSLKGVSGIQPKGEQRTNSFREVSQIAPPKEPPPPKQENKGPKK